MRRSSGTLRRDGDGESDGKCRGAHTKLNEELAKWLEDAACEFTIIGFKLPKPDESGCNWNSAEVLICNDRLPRSIIGHLTAMIIAEAKKKYNLEYYGCTGVLRDCGPPSMG